MASANPARVSRASKVSREQGEQGGRHSSAMPARPWARPRASSGKATPTARWTPGPRARGDAQGRAGARAADAAERRAWGQGRDSRAGNGRQRAQQDTDPLGRPLRGREYGDDVTVKVPGEIDAQRARRILEELRKRYGESCRPQLELDYIERLLKEF